ncbi:hypothetical protein COLO4_19553 [Corchorus olitorius]|uniref:Uncharacterized protein n=1 Tax=Corchorus olitorius TaxID=93759 RepID=A0A1R3J4Y7_9ROSI|nr:hypothetical protein COLO4_19553 [Corchorus olitorius]
MKLAACSLIQPTTQIRIRKRGEAKSEATQPRVTPTGGGQHQKVLRFEKGV